MDRLCKGNRLIYDIPRYMNDIECIRGQVRVTASSSLTFKKDASPKPVSFANTEVAFPRRPNLDCLLCLLNTVGLRTIGLKPVARRFETSFVKTLRKRQLLTQAVVRVIVLL